MVKYRERLRRKMLRLLPGLCAALCVVAGLGCALGWICFNQQLVRVEDPHGTDTLRVSTTRSLSRMLEQAGVTLGEFDLCRADTLSDGTLLLDVQRGWAVQVCADGETVDLFLQGGTVGDALEQAGVELGEEDYTHPSLDSEIENGSVIEVHRVEYREYTRQEVLQPVTEYVETSLYYRTPDYVGVRQEAQEGLAERTYRQKYVDGELESEEMVRETILTPIQNEILLVYGEDAPVSSLEGPELENGVPVEYTQVLTGRASGYSASDTAPGSWGKGLFYGTCAVNPALIPLGSKLYITSTDGRFVYGYAYAADVGTAMLEGRVLVDLFYETYDESVSNAIIDVNVYVVAGPEEAPENPREELD